MIDTFDNIEEYVYGFSYNSIDFWLLESVLLNLCCCFFRRIVEVFCQNIMFSKEAVILTIKVEILD